nr:hypothetical protein [uncultured Rhodoferax sp.]
MTDQTGRDNTAIVQRIRRIAISLAISGSLLTTGCGGGGGAGTDNNGMAPTPPAPITQSYAFVSPQDNRPVNFACGNSDGDAAQARYPGQYASFPSIQMVALPDGGLLGRANADSGGAYAYFTIDSQGRRTPYSARTPDVLRVDAEGKLWWVDANQVLRRGALQSDGKDERVGSATSFSGSPVDGPADQVALGTIKSFAARSGVVYLLVQDGSANRFYLRSLTRSTDGSWQVSTTAVPDSVASAGFDVKVLTNRAGTVALVATSPTKTPPELFNTTITRPIAVTYWQLRTDNSWQAMASKSYELWSSNIYSSNTLALESVALTESGDLVWGGGLNGNLFAMGQNGSWSLLASPAGVNASGVGTNGNIAQATFLSAHNVVTASDGNIIFYDAVTCQVRKLAGTTLSTVSGPSYTARAHFGNTTLLGFDGNDHLVFANQNKWLAPPTARYDTANARFSAQDNTGPISVYGGDGCANNGTRGLSCSSYGWQPSPLLPSQYQPPQYLIGYDKGTDTTYAIANSKIYRRSSSGYQAVGPAPWAASGGRSHDFPYLIGNSEQFEPILYRFDTTNNSLQAIAGRTVESPLYNGKRTLLNSGETQFVQKRSDNGFWLAGTGIVGRITSTGDWTGVAGIRAPTSDLSQPIDGQGSAARFANIKRLRVLPDNRLLVLDANAVRLVDDSGNVRTLFTLADTGLPGFNWVDMIPKGRDLYLTLDSQPRLVLAKNVLP